MSMNLYLRRVSAADVARYRRHGVDDSDLDILDEAPAAAAFTRLWELERGFVAREGVAAFSIAAREMLAEPLVQGASAGRRGPLLDLHKSWRMLHFLFTGEAWEGELPAATLLAGGREVGEDLGDGPARVVSIEETAGFARFLKRLDHATLLGRLDARAMKALGIYCAGNADPDAVAELKDDLAHYFPRLRAFVADASARREGLLIWML